MKPAHSKPPEPPRGDSPHDIERIVPASGWFLGSSGSLFLEQWAADIYLQPYWDTIGWLYRVTTISVSWGISLAVVEIAFRAGPHLLHPTPWQISALGYLRIHVQDFGQIPVPNALRPDIPLIAALAPPPGPIAVYQLVGGPLIIGHSMPWHHTIELTKVVGKTDSNAGQAGDHPSIRAGEMWEPRMIM